MKHFQDDKEEVEETNDDFEGSMLFRHWKEDEDEDDYGSILFRHWKED